MRESLNYQYFQFLRQQIATLRRGGAAAWEAIDWEEIDAVFEDLQVGYRQLQVSLEAAEEVGETLFQQKEDYFELFQFSPIASFVTDANGVILEANQAIAQLLNVSHRDLVGKPLVAFVAGDEHPSEELQSSRTAFRTYLTQLSHSTGTQIRRLSLCPRDRESILVELHIAIARNTDGQIKHLRIGVYNLSQSQETLTSGTLTSGIVSPAIASQLPGEVSAFEELQRLDVTQTRTPPLPQSFDGLRVLIVDDEADVREFMASVLEAQGIGVKTVASAAAALEALEQFRPDVLLSDIRMPGEDGYSLIRQVRALETQQGRHLPAAAMTAYLDEDREKALQAGFEAHLHKLIHPNEWLEMVAHLARQNASSAPDS